TSRRSGKSSPTLLLRTPQGRGDPAISSRNELERDPVVAVAQPGGLWPVVEHVALVASATRTVVLGARDDYLVVGHRLNATGDHVIEARPAGAAVVLGLRVEQGQLASGADERAFALLVVEGARER